MIYIKKDTKMCAVIKKDEVLAITNKIHADVKRFSKDALDKNPKKRYKQIDNYFEQLNVTKALLELYPSKFKDADFSHIAKVKQTLSKIKETTYPQFVLFHIKGEQKIDIKLDNNIVSNNKEHYIKHGDHSYEVTTRGRCPIKGTFSTDLFDNEEINEDFKSKSYPTVIFMTDKSINIVLNGKIIKPNVVTPIIQCEGDIRYVAKFSGQSRDGELSLKPGASHQVVLDFLTSNELVIFNDAKTKKFTTISGVKFSESLTSISSEKLKFIVEESAEHGDVELHESGGFKYTPKDGFVGVDSFEYIIKTSKKTSAPKVVTITINPSNAPVVALAVVPVVASAITSDANITKKVVDQAVEKKDDKEPEMDETRYQKFKIYVNSQENNMDKLKKLSEQYPDMFGRLLKEKLSNIAE